MGVDLSRDRNYKFYYKNEGTDFPIRCIGCDKDTTIFGAMIMSKCLYLLGDSWGGPELDMFYEIVRSGKYKNMGLRCMPCSGLPLIPFKKEDQQDRWGALKV